MTRTSDHISAGANSCGDWPRTGMDYEEALRRWPSDATEALAFQLMRCYVAVDEMRHDGIGAADWSATDVAHELLRRLHARARHIAEDFGRDETTITLNILTEITNRLVPHEFDPEAARVFRQNS